jgi:hypothetical protein
MHLTISRTQEKYPTSFLLRDKGRGSSATCAYAPHQGSLNRGKAGSHGSKKPAGKPVKPAGSRRLKNFRHGLGVGTGPVHVPGRTGPVPPGTGQTGLVPNGLWNPASHARGCHAWRAPTLHTPPRLVYRLAPSRITPPCSAWVPS